MNAVNAGIIAQVAVIEPWAWYQGALKNPEAVGSEKLPVHPGEFQLGYYRVRRKGGDWEPVGIYPDDDGKAVAFRGQRQVDDIPELFVWACRNPVSYDAYVKALAGDGWDDEPAKAAAIGDNSSEADPFDALRIEYLGEKELAEEFLKTPIKSKADADRASIWAKRLSDISKKATDHHRIEKQPSLDEGRRIDDRWRELKEDPKALSTKLKRHQDEWLNEQDRLEKERQRKAREEAERIRRVAIEAEHAAHSDLIEDESVAEQRRVEAERLARQAADAAREAEARTVTAGRTGARTSLRTFVSAEITDYDALLVALKDREEIKEIVQSLANRAAKAGVALSGMKIVEERRAV